MVGRCEPDDVLANCLDPWHGAWFHPYSFANLRVTSVPDERADRLGVEVTPLPNVQVDSQVDTFCGKVDLCGSLGEAGELDGDAHPRAWSIGPAAVISIWHRRPVSSMTVVACSCRQSGASPGLVRVATVSQSSSSATLVRLTASTDRYACCTPR